MRRHVVIDQPPEIGDLLSCDDRHADGYSASASNTMYVSPSGANVWALLRLWYV